MENFEGALNNIIKMMNVTEREKLKRVEVLAGLEKKVARRIQAGQTEEAIEELKDLIDDYKRLDLVHKAQVLELTLNQLLLEKTDPFKEVEEPSMIEGTLDEQTKLEALEYRSKKAIRRFLQGKTDDAIEELLDIIEDFREINLPERAQALEEWMYQFLGKKLDYEEETKPLAERLKMDPELQEQLLSFRTQQILKRFLQGDPRKAVLEYNEVVNDYKRQGRLDIVETLEIWFNLFITKTYLVPSQTLKSESSSVETTPPPPAETDQSLSPTDKFKEKISKIKSLIKKFEESI